MPEFKKGDRVRRKGEAGKDDPVGTVLDPAELGLPATEGDLVRWDDERRTDENAGSLEEAPPTAPPPVEEPTS